MPTGALGAVPGVSSEARAVAKEAEAVEKATDLARWWAASSPEGGCSGATPTGQTFVQELAEAVQLPGGSSTSTETGRHTRRTLSRPRVARVVFSTMSVDGCEMPRA